MKSPSSAQATIGVIGDVHLFWDDHDVRYFNSSGYDLLVFVGDIAGYSQRGGLKTARSIAGLSVPTFVLPGNHDGVHALQLLSEIMPRARRARRAFCAGQEQRCQALDKALGGVDVVGYSRHRLDREGWSLNIVCARPHSIGGRRVACQRYLARRFGVDSMEGSARRLKELIDACDDAPILFVAHNGPFGLGDRANDIWGCDFRGADEDWGDRDLTEAIAHARGQGRNVLGTVAGHMHRRSKKGGLRPSQVTRDGVLYVNAAEVPRHRRRENGLERHHVRLVTDGRRMTAEDLWV